MQIGIIFLACVAISSFGNLKERQKRINVKIIFETLCISEQITRMKNVNVIVNLILTGNSVTRFLFKETKLFSLERVSYPLTLNLAEEFLKSSHFIRIFLYTRMVYDVGRQRSIHFCLNRRVNLELIFK